MTIRVGIMGYGNLGRGVECALRHCSDMELAAVFTRRNASRLKIRTAGVSVISAEKATDHADKIDVMILCGGSSTDLRWQSPKYARYFNIVDSFDTHAEIQAHYDAVNEAAARSGKLSVISAGWDPGMFSLNRLYASAIMPQGQSYTFWGPGLSQGHSDAIRRLEGVVDARQYTVPREEAMEIVRRGDCPQLTAGDKHVRRCFVVAEDGADRDRITREIETMPNYFDEYTTTVEFITQDEMDNNHKSMAHGGFVIHSGRSGWDLETPNVIEYRLDLRSNPEFTGSVLVAVARAAVRMHNEGQTGCRIMPDIPPTYLTTMGREEIMGTML